MDSAIRMLKTSTLKAQVVLCRIVCEALETAFSQPGVSTEKLIELFQQWDAAVRDCEDAEHRLAVMNIDEMESHDGGELLEQRSQNVGVAG